MQTGMLEMNFNALGRAVVPPPVLPRDRRVHSDELGHAGELTRGLLPHGTEGLAVVAPGGVEHDEGSLHVGQLGVEVRVPELHHVIRGDGGQRQAHQQQASHVVLWGLVLV